MTILPDRLIGDAYTSTTPWHVLEDLVQIGSRLAGNRGEERGAAIIAAAFRDVGLRDVETNEFEISGWWRGSTILEVSSPQPRVFEHPHEIIAYPLTASCEIDAEIVDVGYGTPEEIAEATLDKTLAMAKNEVPNEYGRSVSRMEKYVRVMEAGAAGFIFRNMAKGGLPPTSSAPAAVPNVGVSREVGAHLSRYCEQGTPSARLSVESKTGITKSRNVSAVVGPQTDEEVVVSAHIDAHDIGDGARDNGVGCALVVEVGRLLKSIEDELETQVRLVTFGAEEFGLFGAHHWAETHDTEGVKCVVNIDAAGNSRTLQVRTNEFDDVATVFESVTDSLHLPIETMDGIGSGTDAWAFVQRGIPAVTAASSSTKPAHAEVERGRGWGHTHADTIDKLDRRDLRDLSLSITGAVLKLAAKETEISRTPVSAIEEKIDEYTETTLRALGRWPYE